MEILGDDDQFLPEMSTNYECRWENCLEMWGLTIRLVVGNECLRLKKEQIWISKRKARKDGKCDRQSEVGTGMLKQ